MPKPYSRDKLRLNSLEYLGRRIGFPVHEIQDIAGKAATLYRFKEEPKKSGGFRVISKPHPHLKKVQASIHNLLTEISVSEAAHGGVRGRSNLTNAKVHCKSRQVINFDIKNFYPSISHYRVYNLFHRTLGCSPPVASILTKLTTVNGQTPQGSPVSADIANLVLRDADRWLLQLANKSNLKYTRYIDDMTFSGDTIPSDFAGQVEEIISLNGFKLNKDKQLLMKKDRAQQVTGLNVNRKNPTVPRTVKRQILMENHVFTKFEAGLIDEETRCSRHRKIRGKLAYLDYIKKHHGNNSI